jgi:hypothetical protein
VLRGHAQPALDFQSELHRGNSSSAGSADHTSPRQRILNVEEPCHPASSKSRHVAGAACMIVTRQRSINAIDCLSSTTALLEAIATHAPIVSGKNTRRVFVGP